MSLRFAIRQNIDSLDDLRQKIYSMKTIIERDDRIDDDVKKLLLKYEEDISDSFTRCAYSFGDVIDEAYE